MSPSFFSPTRRAIIQCTALGFCIPVVVSGCGQNWETKLDRICLRLTSSIQQSSLTTQIGLRYLNSETSYIDLTKRRLAQQILWVLNLNISKADNISDDKLEKLISLRVQRDFSDEKVIFTGGWVLSKLEASLCALAFLIG